MPARIVSLDDARETQLAKCGQAAAASRLAKCVAVRAKSTNTSGATIDTAYLEWNESNMHSEAKMFESSENTSTPDRARCADDGQASGATASTPTT